MTNRRLRSNRFLPMYVTTFNDRHKKPHLRFRRKGYPDHYFKAALGTEEFRIEYAACMDPRAPLEAAKAAAIARTIPGSLDDLFARYVAVSDRLGPTVGTQKRVRGVIERFVEGRGERMVRDLRFEHLDAIIARARVKTGAGNKARGGISAAKKLRKELKRFFAFAVKIGMISSNPVDHTDRVRVAPAERSGGYHTWTEAEITQFRDFHALGTMARVAMELMLWTDQRRVDSIHLGRQHIQEGRFKITQTKTGKTLWIPVAPQLLEAIVALPAPTQPGMCFLLNEYGRPFSKAGFGNKMRDWCDQAGLPKCTAHGLRKATMRRMAELDMGNQTMKGLSGHTRDDEVARYTAEANQKRLARDAIGRLVEWEKLPPEQREDVLAQAAIAGLAAWEKSNLADGIDIGDNQGAVNAR